MKIKAYLIFLSLSLSVWSSAKDYKASLFGVKSDGVTLNTGSIQKAIDFISEKGGGKLVFYVGRYLTGTIELKPNVTIQLEEGAVLVASTSAYNYYGNKEAQALIVAENSENIGITGKGVIEGQGGALRENISEQIQKGYIINGTDKSHPALVNFNRCSNAVIDGIILNNACKDVLTLFGCKNIIINNITIESTLLSDSEGIVVSNSNGITVSHSYLNTSGKEIRSNGTSENVSVKNCINSKGEKLQVTK